MAVWLRQPLAPSRWHVDRSPSCLARQRRSRRRCWRRVVALSFDDGPDPRYTPAVLRLRERDGAHATFFLIGRRALAEPSLVRAELAAGNEIGDHTLDHRILTGSRRPMPSGRSAPGRTPWCPRARRGRRSSALRSGSTMRRSTASSPGTECVSSFGASRSSGRPITRPRRGPSQPSCARSAPARSCSPTTAARPTAPRRSPRCPGYSTVCGRAATGSSRSRSCSHSGGTSSNPTRRPEFGFRSQPPGLRKDQHDARGHKAFAITVAPDRSARIG